MSPTEMRDMIVADVMERWPATVQVFNARRMACPGCVMSPFMTVAEAAASYNLDEAELAEALIQAAPGAPSAAPPEIEHAR